MLAQKQHLTSLQSHRSKDNESDLRIQVDPEAIRVSRSLVDSFQILTMIYHGVLQPNSHSRRAENHSANFQHLICLSGHAKLV